MRGVYLNEVQFNKVKLVQEVSWKVPGDPLTEPVQTDARTFVRLEWTLTVFNGTNKLTVAESLFLYVTVVTNVRTVSSSNVSLSFGVSLYYLEDKLSDQGSEALILERHARYKDPRLKVTRTRAVDRLPKAIVNDLKDTTGPSNQFHTSDDARVPASTPKTFESGTWDQNVPTIDSINKYFTPRYSCTIDS